MLSKKRLPNHKDGEKVIMHFWKHPFVFFKIFLLYFLLFLIPIAVWFLIQLTWTDLLANQSLMTILTVLGLIYYLLLLVFVFTIWTFNYLDVWTLSTERIVSRNQLGFFNRIVSELELYQVQDVTVEQKGVFATIFNYGHLYIQTAGEVNRFTFEDVPNPLESARLIQQLDEEAKRCHNNPSV